jgi:hypothetical protein
MFNGLKPVKINSVKQRYFVNTDMNFQVPQNALAQFSSTVSRNYSRCILTVQTMPIQLLYSVHRPGFEISKITSENGSFGPQ